jgi:TatD DNase family protein
MTSKSAKTPKTSKTPSQSPHLSHSRAASSSEVTHASLPTETGIKEIPKVESATSDEQSSFGSYFVDIGINLHNKQMLKTWRKQVQRAHDANVTTIILTGTSIQCSSSSLKLAEAFQTKKPSNMNNMHLYCTVGIHPHDAKLFRGDKTIQTLRSLLQHPLAVAVGECGLDYNRNFSTPSQQLLSFEEHIKLACELKKPLFIHEREAHEDVVALLNTYLHQLPPVVIHCFTGSAAEAQTYLSMGFYIGFTGTICKFERGKPLRDLLPTVPLERIMLETDAPFMGFVKGRRESEPKDVALVAAKVAEVLGVDVAMVREITTANAKSFFNI